MPDPLHDRKILVIDDDPKILERVRLLFARAGAHVSIASNARQGLRRFYDQRPDLVILDLILPDLDGWDACERLRELSDVPIMMLTALNQTENVVYVHVYVHRLRQKLEQDPTRLGYLLTEPGVGYRFESRPTPPP